MPIKWFVRSWLTRSVLTIGLVSFLNDAASDMIAPLLPLFLTATLGAGPAIIGLIEGVAESTASLLKLLSGWIADRGFDKKRLMLGGYSCSNLARPLMAFATSWGAVLFLRFLDRVGKGLRSAPRDAMLSAAVTQAERGRAFGFHRMMDHSGAMLGPLIAFALLTWAHASVVDVFLYSAIPGVLVVLLIIFGLPQDAKNSLPVDISPPRAANWRGLDHRIRSLVIAAGILALAAMPDAFLVLWAQAGGIEVVWIPLLWAAAHFARALVSLPAGWLSDHYGRVPVVAVGWSARVLCLLLLCTSPASTTITAMLFILYAMSTAITEGAERALIGDHVASDQRGTAFGFYHFLTGLLVLPGAILFGWLWQQFSSGVAFFVAAVVTAVGAIIFMQRVKYVAKAA